MERYDQAAVGYVINASLDKFALRQEVCPGLLLVPLDKMLVHCRVTPQQYVTGTHKVEKNSLSKETARC